MAEPGAVLVGLPGSGKTTVGRIVAERLGRPFVDTDEMLGRRLGSAPSAYLAAHGEASFRLAEAEVIKEACALTGAVIATGGGAVLDPLSRWALWHHGTVGWLDVAPELLVDRLRTDPVERPTVQPYGTQRMATVLAAREAMYRAADVRLDGSGPPAAVADSLIGGLGARQSRRLYDSEVERHHPVGPARARVVMGVELDRPDDGAVAIVDARLLVEAPDLVGRVMPGRALPVAGGERAKRMRFLERILDWLADQRVERGTPVVAVGGGTIGDLAGTAAALYARGLPLVQVPTTWLAQADSAIGGKVAIDLRGAKNQVGAFWPPIEVISDVAALRSLPVRHRRDGMAESVKSALIGDPGLWELIEGRGVGALRTDEAARYAIIERSARLKLDVCDRDPFEDAERRTLNLGHTLGHALEIASGYRLSHGSAVALGLRGVAAISAGRGADPELAPRLDELLEALGFRLHLTFDVAAVQSAIGVDKKRAAGRQRWILPMEIGRVIEVDDVTGVELGRALKTIQA